MDWLALLSIPLLLTVLVSGRVAPVHAFAALASLFVLLGIIDTNTFLNSFSNSALVTLILLLMASLAVEQSPLLVYLSDKIITNNEKTSFFRLTGIATLLSAFMNNTAVVSAFLPAITRQQKIAPSRLLIPLSFASILGGVITLVGTSTNLVVNSFVVDANLPPLGMFSFVWVGVPVAIACTVALYFQLRLLPNHGGESLDAKNAYFLTAEVLPQASICGKTIAESGLQRLDDLYLLEIQRDKHLITPVGPHERILPGDHLIFTGSIHNLSALHNVDGLNILGENAADILLSNLVEVVIAHESDLVDKTLNDISFRQQYNAGVVGLRRGSKRLTGRLARIPLRVGDTLILAVGSDFAAQPDIEKDFHILTTMKRPPSMSKRQGVIVLGGFAAAILAATFHVMPLLHALLILLGFYIAAGYLTFSDIKRRFPLELLVIIGSALAISKGMESSGATVLIGRFMQYAFADVSVYVAFIGIFFMTVLTTEIITNNAAAALSIPIALSTASALNVSPTPFAMAVAYGASACFIMPFGYQTHLMVFAPGRYTVQDYIRVGIPITAIYSLVVLLLIPVFFPFNP